MVYCLYEEAGEADRSNYILAFRCHFCWTCAHCSSVCVFDKSKIEPDFTGYQPTVPLSGAVVTSAHAKAGSSSIGGKVFPPNYTQSYDSGIVLVQSKAKRSSPAACEKPITAEAEAVLTYECQAGDIEDGNNSYAVTTVYKAGELIDISVSAKIGDTYMFLDIPEDQEVELARYTDWQNYFRSMKPVKITAD